MRLGLRTSIGLFFVILGLNEAFAEVPLESLPNELSIEVNAADPNLGTGFELEPKLPSILDAGAVSDPTCLINVGEKCVLRSFYREIEFHSSAAGKMFFLLGSGSVESEQVFIHDDLLLRLDRGEVTYDEAEIIATEIAQLEGTYYEIPDIQVLKVDLGFPAETQFAVEDLRELVRTHLQISIGVGPITAAYLCDRMGVQLIEEHMDITPIQVKPIRLIAEF